MKSSAVFIGTNGSMGLQNGTRYEFDLNIDGHYIWINFYGIFGKSIPYSTMKALLKNWRF